MHFNHIRTTGDSTTRSVWGFTGPAQARQSSVPNAGRRIRLCMWPRVCVGQRENSTIQSPIVWTSRKERLFQRTGFQCFAETSPLSSARMVYCQAKPREGSMFRPPANDWP
ncbi:unnamed protein product [Durusdinium trenchii]|uniref:Uncharacterized protein n=1 Tax=Durusdinium trenchii TaxID=1381693 RepID=A0ABP0R9D8_9DINO